MRKIRGAAFVSLDGIMQAPGGPSEDPTGGFQYGAWLPAFFDEAVGHRIDRLPGQVGSAWSRTILSGLIATWTDCPAGRSRPEVADAVIIWPSINLS
jgi:hypothetical protein